MRLSLGPAMIVGVLLTVPATVPTVVPKGATPAMPNAGAGQDAAAYPSYGRSLLLETTSETSANISFGDVDGDGTGPWSTACSSVTAMGAFGRRTTLARHRTARIQAASRT